MNGQSKSIRVWDPLVRIGHWTLVSTFFIAYFTEDDLLTQHVWAGYTVAGVVLVRLLWGFVGTDYARFSNFVRSPSEAMRYLGAIAKNRAARFIGHNPAGGAMIVVLLASLVVTTISGLEIYAIEENAGPLASIQAPVPIDSMRVDLVASAYADDADSDAGDEHEGAEEFWEEIHEAFANITLFLVLLHVAGVAVASISHKENLVKAMITGRKRP